MPKYAIMSYEALSRDKRKVMTLEDGSKKRVVEPAVFSKIIASGQIPAIIADECHKIANPQSIMGNALFQLGRQAEFFIGLSATPLPNSWMSVCNYFKIWGFVKHITDFKKRFVNEDRSRGYPIVVGYNHEDDLREGWSRISKRLKKEDVLPPSEILEVKAPLPSTKEYQSVAKHRQWQGELLDNPSKYTHALRQVTVDGKLDWLESVLDGTDENVLIFYNYIREREAVLKVLSTLKKSHVFRIDGQVQNQPKKADWGGLTNTVTLAQYQSGSTGIELTYTSVIIFLSPTYSYAQYMQSIGRADRIGQTKPITMYKPYLKGTIEVAVWGAIARKQSFQEDIWLKEVGETW